MLPPLPLAHWLTLLLPKMVSSLLTVSSSTNANPTMARTQSLFFTGAPLYGCSADARQMNEGRKEGRFSKRQRYAVEIWSSRVRRVRSFHLMITHIFLPFDHPCVSGIMPISQMRKLNFRMVDELAHSHTVSDQAGSDLSEFSSLLCPVALLLNPAQMALTLANAPPLSQNFFLGQEDTHTPSGR